MLDKHESVRGSQYVSIKYTERLAEAGIEPSVGSVGDSYDNLLIHESPLTDALFLLVSKSDEVTTT